ncbi:MAG: GDP-mannose 4,6-dehydratase [Deltaproteobacteria bacterium]|nr:GDP-mannose 4,6-dehydratase [Deltaproteobacteria bacterium]
MKNYYKDKKVLVTGADGFIGFHLTERLVACGADVSVFVRANSTTGTNMLRLKNISHLTSKLKTIIAADIGSRDATELIKKEKPRIIFHLAADAYVNRSFKQPREVIRTNVDGTINVLHACLDENGKPADWVERIVCTSSSEIYGHHEEPIDESFELKPSSPYGASKAAADRIAFSYFNTFGLPVAIIRPFNTYGPRHTYDAPPKFIALALADKDITIYGDGTQTRDLSYVDDTVEGFLTMGFHKEAEGEAVNFGTGKDTSIKDLAQKIITLSGSTSKIVHVAPRLAEVQRLCSNPSKAKKLFGWKAGISLEEGLRRNIAWMKQ